MNIDTAKLRELAQAATPGPWVVDSHYTDCGGKYTAIEAADGSEVSGEYGPSEKDAAYIAAAHPAAVLALLDENARLREALQFYADKSNWRAAQWDDGCETPHAIPMYPNGPDPRYCDCGDTARAALSGGAA